MFFVKSSTTQLLRLDESRLQSPTGAVCVTGLCSLEVAINICRVLVALGMLPAQPFTFKSVCVGFAKRKLVLGFRLLLPWWCWICDQYCVVWNSHAMWITQSKKSYQTSRIKFVGSYRQKDSVHKISCSRSGIAAIVIDTLMHSQTTGIAMYLRTFWSGNTLVITFSLALKPV